jgi:hypothetical protein
MLNLAIQFVTILNGLLFNFATPAVFGVAAYGEFIAANAAVFLIAKTLDIVTEPLIRFTEHRHLLIVSLVLSILVTALFLIHPWGSPLFLFSMLVASNAILAMHALARKRALLVFQSSVVLLFSILTALSYLQEISLPIVRIMEFSIAFPTASCVLYLFATGVRIPPARVLFDALKQVVRLMPNLLSVTAVYNILTNALPLILATTLSARDFGIFRIATSVAQSASAVFPINTRAIFAAMVKSDVPATLWASLSRLAAFYFALVGMGMILLGVILPQIAHYMFLAAVAPILYWSMLAERYWLSRHAERTIITINLAVGAGILVAAHYAHDLHSAMLVYATGFALYALCLALIRKEALRMVPIILFCPVAVALGPWVGLRIWRW